jgi:uncharacterized membrane protein YdbT with pleckstrin-like domain
MQSPLVPGNDAQLQVKPERIYAAILVLPYAGIAVIFALWASRYASVFYLMPSIFILLAGFYKYLLVLSASYYLTGQQLIIKRGVFTRKFNYLELYRIKDILVDQPLWMNASGLMNITLLSFDTAESLLILKGIRVSSLPQTIRNHVQECRRRNKVLTVDN